MDGVLRGVSVWFQSGMVKAIIFSMRAYSGLCVMGWRLLMYDVILRVFLRGEVTSEIFEYTPSDKNDVLDITPC